MPSRKWRMVPPVERDAAPELEGWPSPLRQLLYNRGLHTMEQVERFIYPGSTDMGDPFLLRGMDAAVERIYRALRGDELIGIYGDFDADGLTAAALLAEVLESPSLQGRVTTYLPHRVREGYGLNQEAVRSLAARGVRLLITVDCGMGNEAEVRLAAGLGMDVIVTDHHLVAAGVPTAVAVLNPHQEGCAYPFKELAGVGVAYKLAEALLAKVWDLEEARRRLSPQMDLVALGTVADLAPLVGENRLMVRLGLQQINRGDRVGLRALAFTAGYSTRGIDAEGIGYVLAPRLNAAGRMGDARTSLELLTTRSEEEALRLAAELEVANRERQAATAAALEAAREELSGIRELPPAIVLAGEFPAGVVGLVAGKLAEEFNRPSFVVELGEDVCRGSGRGCPGFDVVRALSAASDLLVRFGGHAQAGGFTVAASQLGPLRQRLESAAEEQLVEVGAPAELLLEASLRAREVGPALYEQLALLEPFGMGNERPLFYTSRLLVRDARVVGARHLKLWLADDSGTSAAIGFGMGVKEYEFARPGVFVDCAYTLGRNEYAGTIGYEMVLKDVRRSSPRSGGA